jgi:hypothetical protein
MYQFNVRAVVRVLPGVDKTLTQLVGRRGIILYHAEYEEGEPTMEAVLIGMSLPHARHYKHTGQIKVTIGGTIHVIPVKFLRNARDKGRELAGEGVLI